ncbi:hypothetical protein ACZ91_60845 [Streptomyces regensis]|nr:hypothetical protein ACZ91_60845 [Streptomyces regensis]
MNATERESVKAAVMSKAMTLGSGLRANETCVIATSDGGYQQEHSVVVEHVQLVLPLGTRHDQRNAGELTTLAEERTADITSDSRWSSR